MKIAAFLLLLGVGIFFVSLGMAATGPVAAALVMALGGVLLAAAGLIWRRL